MGAPPPIHVCSICAHAHRAAIDARLLSKKEDGSNEHSATAVVAWMNDEGWTPLPLSRTLNRHRKLHLGVTEHVAKRAVAAAKAKAAGEAPPAPELLAPAVEAAIAVEGANIAALDEWSADLARLRRHLIAKAMGTLPGAPVRLPSERTAPAALEPQEVSFLVHGGRATALLAATRNQILTGGKGGRGGLGTDDSQKGLKELVEGLKHSPPPIEGDRADDEPAPTKEEIEASLAEVGGVEVQGQAFGPDVAADDEDEDIARPAPKVIDMPAAPDPGPKATASAGEPPVPYVYKPPPLRLVAK